MVTNESTIGFAINNGRTWEITAGFSTGVGKWFAFYNDLTGSTPAGYVNESGFGTKADVVADVQRIFGENFSTTRPN